MTGNLGVPMITIIIIAMNVLFSMKGFSDFGFFEKYKFNVAAIRNGEQIRMITSGFLHADWSHLGFNMLALYFFADDVVLHLGVIELILIYVGSLLLGNILSFYFHRDEYHYSAVGASGAVMGVLYCAILFDPWKEINFIPAWIFGVAYLLYSIWGMKAKRDNIGHDAHFGGAIAGYFLTLALAPNLIETSTVFVVLLAVPIVLLFILHKLGKI